MKVSVHRSPWALVTMVVLAVPAILLAVDMLVSHRWVPRPETYDSVVGTTVDENGVTTDLTVPVYTDLGEAQRRRDVLAGSVLLAGGVAAMGYAGWSLYRPRPVLHASDDGIAIGVDGPGRPRRLLPWDSIAEVRSGVRDADGAELPVLSIRLVDPGMVPPHPSGAVADPPWLHVWADDWDRPVHQVAAQLDPRLRRARA